jgi:NDP-sugar pyrophosphorylase family protein
MHTMSKRAVILAGGKGTRLRPYTLVLPKPLMPIGEYPILEVIIRQLVSHDFDHITISVNHQSELIKAFFGNGEKLGVKIDYCQEDKPLNTMGPLQLIPDLPENFLIMNGDVLTDLNFSNFYHHHAQRSNVFTISSFIRDHVNDYGVLIVGEDKKLNDFKEKPVTRFEVSMGVYMASPEILKFIPKNTAYGFDTLMLDLISAKNPASVKIHDGYWLDIGRPDDYSIAIDKFETERSIFLK